MTCASVPKQARKLILEVLDSGQFSPGKKVRELEERLAKLHQAKHAIFVNSGTDALRLSLLALKEKYSWPDGSLVLVPALTFVATVNVILQAKLAPMFADVGMNDYLINPYRYGHNSICAEDPVAWKKLKCVLPVHLFGQACGEKIFELARRYGLKVLEDSCETILNPLRGDASCHSTYMAHHLTTGVGGFALTNDDKLNLLIRSYANHGRDTAYLPGYAKIPLSKALLQRRFKFNRIGYSCRATEFEAALGLAQLDDLATNVAKRQNVGQSLLKALDLFPDFSLPRMILDTDKDLHSTLRRHTFMMFPIVIAQTSRLDKYDLCLHLEKHGIETRDMMPITNQPCYAEMFYEENPNSHQGGSAYGVSGQINKDGFYIPCHQGMTNKDVDYIAQVFQDYGLHKIDSRELQEEVV